MKTVCPVCKKPAPSHITLDGYGNVKTDGPVIIDEHGTKGPWGRIKVRCPGSDRALYPEKPKPTP